MELYQLREKAKELESKKKSKLEEKELFKKIKELEEDIKEKSFFEKIIKSIWDKI